MNIVLLGPYGSGKSTLVRRLMKPRTWKKVYRSSPTPWSYTSSDLIVYGNYERTTRARHGMVVFDRDYLAFDLVLRQAAEEKLNGIMEGGFAKTDRLWAGCGPMFAQTAYVIWMGSVGEPRDRLGRKLTDEGIVKYELKMFKTFETFKQMGSKIEMIGDWQLALESVCELLGLKVPTDDIEEDYR